MLEKADIVQPGSQKLRKPFRGPYIIKRVLPRDRYVVAETGRHGRQYESVWAADKIKRVGKLAMDSSNEEEDSEDDRSEK